MKKIGNCIYVHISNIKELDSKSMKLYLDTEKFINNIPYEVVKIDKKNNCVTFIQSEDWDIEREPTVGDSYKVTTDGSIKITRKKKNVQIYHHKWMFVSSDYRGFDIEESKRWSELWQSILPSTREVKSRIGYKAYWENIIREYGL